MTEDDDLEDMARQGNREAFDRVLAKVPDLSPDPWDRWDGEASDRAEVEVEGESF